MEGGDDALGGGEKERGGEKGGGGWEGVQILLYYRRIKI